MFLLSHRRKSMSAKTQAQKAYNRYKQAQKNQKKKKVVTTQTQQQRKTNQAVTRRATGNYSSFKGVNPGRTSEGSVQNTTSKRYTQEEAPARRNQQELQRQRREHQTQTTGQRMSSEDQSRIGNLFSGAVEQSVGQSRKLFSGFMSGVTESRAKGDTYGGTQAHRNGTQRYMTRRDDRLSPEQLKTKETDIQKSKVTSHALDVVAEKYTKEESKAASKQIARGTEKIEKGKEGLGAVGRFGADLFTGAVQLGADIGIGALTGSALLPMGVRAFGGAVDEAEKAGASWKKQMMYGATTAGIELGTEKLFNVGAALNKAYGAGVGDKLVEKLTKKVGKSALKGGLSEVGAAALTEGLEEMVAEGLEPMVANAIYANAIGGDAVQTSLLNNPTQAGLNILRAGGIGAALGAPLGGAGVVMQNYQGKKISENAQNIYGEDGIKEMARQARESEDEGDAAFAQAVYNAINEGKGVANIQVAKLQGVLNSQKERDAKRTAEAYNVAEKTITENNYSAPRQAANAKASESVDVARRVIAEQIPADVEMSDAEKDRIVTTAARIGSGIAGESDIREALSSAESITVMEEVTGLDLGGKSKSVQHDMLIQYAAQQYVDAAQRQTEYDNSTLRNAYKTIKEKDLGVGGQTAFDKIFEEEDVRGLADGSTDFRGEDINDVHNKMYTFEKFYRAGTADMTLEEIRQKDNPVFASLTPQQQEDAYIAGRNDAIAEQNAAYLKDVQVGRKSKKAGTKVRPGHVTLARLSDENKQILTQSRPLFEALAKALGIEIEFRDEITNVNGEIIEEGVNGHYQDGKITISMDNDKADMSKVPLAAIAYVFEHEVTHHMKVFAPAEFFRFKQFVKNKMMTMDSSDGNFANRYEEEIAKKRRQYGNVEEDLLMEEILADATIEFIQDEEFCKEICEQDADTAHAIVKAIRNLMDKIREIMANIVLTDSQRQTLFSELDILKDAEQMWLDGIRVAAERRNAVGETEGAIVTKLSAKSEKGKDPSIRDQIKKAAPILEQMKPVANVTYDSIAHLNRGQKAQVIMKEYNKKFKGGVERPKNMGDDIGFIVLTMDEVTGALKYMHEDGEFAAFNVLPQVLKRGKIIFEKEKHKDKPSGSATIGAPVIINGTLGYMGAVVNIAGKNRYHVHRIMLPDGTEFVFNKKTEPIGANVKATVGDQGLAISSASDDIVQNSKTKVKKSMKELVTLSDQRIDNLIDEYAIPGNTTSNYSKAWITSINPRDFLKLTISDEELEKWTLGSTNVWGQEVRELEPEDLKAKGKYDTAMPFLKVNSSYSHSVTSHEGRHRMLALLRAGYDDVPVVIYDTSESAKSNRQYEERFDLWSQDHGDGPVNSNRRDEEGELGYTVDVYDLIPINEKNRAEIERMYGGDTEVQFSRKYTPEEQQEHRDALLETCKELYGSETTENYNESGYILPDGKMPKMGDYGIRGEDHLVAAVGYGMEFDGIDMFMREGNIRLVPETNGFQITTEPTKNQYDTISKVVDDMYGAVYSPFTEIIVDFTDDYGFVKDTMVFNGTDSAAIIGSIKAHFAGGTVTPMRQFLSRKDSEGRYLSEGQMEYFKDSKARDAYGHLIPVYHSSDAEFTVFDTEKQGSATGAENTAYGFFTTPNEEFSKRFGKNTKKMYANITRPIIHPMNSHFKYPGKEDDIVRTWFETVDPYQIPFMEEAIENDDAVSPYDWYMNTFAWEAFDYAEDEREYVRRAGYDGIELIEGPENMVVEYEGGRRGSVSSFIVFDSNQLKDVDNLNPTDNPDIMLSRREVSFEEEDRKELEDAGLFVSEGGSVSMLSRKSWAATNKEKLKEKLLKAGFEEDEIDSWIKDVDSVAAIIAADEDRLDYVASEQHKFKKPDGDYYKWTMDASTLCAKRLLYQGTYDAIMHQLGNIPLYADDVIRLRQMMAEMKKIVPCGICYVESQRKSLGKYAEEWLNGMTDEAWEKKQKSYQSSLKKYEEGKIKNKPRKPQRWTGYVNMDHKDPYVPTLADVVTTDGLEQMRLEHPEVYESFTKRMKSKGVSSPKLVETRTDYRGDLNRMGKRTVNYLNMIGGLRWNSFSDFEIPHLIDFMQILLDMTHKGLMGMAYTKVPELVKVFGPCGVKFNLSLIPKVDKDGNVEHDKDGRIVFDGVEGMSLEEAMELRDKYPDNVCTILVAKDQEHMREAMEDDRVDFIIPFHRSKWTMDEFDRLGLKGYKDFATGDQENPIFPSEYWDYSISLQDGGGIKNAETYLKLCAERDVKPAFSKLLVDNGDGSFSLPEDETIRNGYYKLIIEGKMFNHKTGKGAPQQKVTMNVDMDAAREVLAAYEGDPNALPVAEDVVKAFVKEKTGQDVDAKSIRLSRKQDTKGRTLSEGQAEFFADVHPIMYDENGNMRVLYHTTNKGGFNVFDPEKSDDKISLFFSDHFGISQTYGQYADARIVTKPIRIDSVEELQEYVEKTSGFDLVHEQGKWGERYILHLPNHSGRASSRPFIRANTLEELLTLFNRQQEGMSEINYEKEGMTLDNVKDVLRENFENGNITAVSINAYFDMDGDYEALILPDDFDRRWDEFKQMTKKQNGWIRNIVIEHPRPDSYTPMYGSEVQKIVYSPEDTLLTNKMSASDLFVPAFEKFNKRARRTQKAGKSGQHGYYEVYGNFKDPLIVDGHGANWNSIVFGPEYDEWINAHTAIEGSPLVITYANVNVFDDASGTAYAEVQITGFRKEDGSYIPIDINETYESHYDVDNLDDMYNAVDTVTEKTTDLFMGLGIDYDTYSDWEQNNMTADGWRISGDHYIDDQGIEVSASSAMSDYDVTYMSTREISDFAYNAGYDSVVILNITDHGPHSSARGHEAGNIFIAFDGDMIKDVDNLNPTSNPNINLSRKATPELDEDEVSDIMASDPTIVDTMYGWGMSTPEGQNLHEQTKDELIAKIEKLKQDMTITDGKILDEKSVREEMNKLVVNMGIEEDRWTGQMLGEVRMNKTNRGLVEDLVQTAKTIWKELQNGNYEAAAISAMNVSEHVVDNLLLTEDTMYKEYKELVDYLKNTKWELNPIYHGDFADGFVEFKKEYRGKIRIVKNGGRSPDELWGEMCELWPEFFTEDITNPAEMMKRMAEVRDSLDPYSAMLSEENQQLILRDAAADIIEIVSNGKPLETWADKRENYYREKIAKLKARQQEAIRDIKEKQNWKDAEKKLATQMAEGKKKAQQQRTKQESKEKKADDKGKRQTIAKISKNLDWLSGRLLKPSDDKHLPEGYRNVVAQMLAAIDPQTERSKALEEKYGVSKKRFKWLQLRSEYEKIAAGESYGFILDDQIMADMQELSDVLGDGDFALANMTYDELQKVYRIVRSIRHGIQMQNKMFSDELKGRAEDYGRNAIETAETYINDHGTDRKGVAGKIHGSGMPLLDEGMLTPRDYFEYIGGGLNEAFLAMRRGQDEQIKKINYMRSFFESIFRDYGKTTRVRHRAKPGSELEAWRDGKNKKSFQCEGGTIELTPSQVMSLYCLMKREQAQGHILGSGIKAAVVNKKNLLLGENLKEFFTGKGDKKTRGRRVSVTAEDIMNIVSSLTEEQRDIADKMQTLMSTVMSDWGNEASMKMFGYRKFTEENYFPIECESTYLATDFDVRQTAERVKNPNFAKSTQKGANNPVVIDDIFSVCADHCNRMAMYSSYAPAIADFQRVYNFVDRDPETGLQNGSVKESLQAAYGDRALKYIERFMTDLNGTTPTTLDDLNRFVAKSLANYKKAAIGGNLRVAVQQPTAMIRALLYISPKYFMGKMSPVKEIREMKEHCPIALWKSWGFSQVDMARDLEDIMMNQEWSRFDMLTMEIYNFLDLVTWGQIWRAVKNEVKAEHKDVEVGSDEFYRLCNERASYIFDKSQVVDSVFHKSQVMRNTDVMSKMFTSFMAEPMRTFNMVGSEIQRAAKMWQDGDKSGAMKVYTKAFNVFILNAATVSAAAAVVDMMRGKGGDDDDDDDKLSLLMHNFIENMKSNALPHTFIPVVSDVVELFTDSWGAKNMSLEGYEKLAKSVKDMFDEDKTWAEKIKGLVENGGYVFGIPTKNVMRELQTALDILGIEIHAAEESDEVDDVKLTDKFFSMFKDEDKKAEKKSEKKEEDEEEEELEDYIDTTNKHGLIDKALRKMDFEEGGTIDNFLDKHGLTMTDKEARERAVNEKVEKVMAKGEGKSGEEKDKAIWKATTEKYTKYLDQGDMDTIKEMREVYTKAGGDGAYFDEKVLGKMKSSYKKTIGDFDKLSEQEDMKNYMLDKGMTEEEISSEIVYKSDTAKKFAIAAQEGKDVQAIACLVSLYMAGMTDADAQKLWENRWRYGNGKNKAGHGTGQFSWPCSGRISSYFGRRNAPTRGASSYHPAIDIAVSSGTTVCAADGGVVVYTGYNGGYGNSVGIDHGNGFVTYYNHLSSYNVQKGQMIKKGQPVALSGNTGTSTGPHLDFKILKDGSPVDPMKYLN